ncbi:hypothetical protein [Fusobacterium sp. PH5-44]|uniref:hypothetical protein n=1 Tax=unclassified Fusobacterium TaxID=2648384 RepID=UPI003D1E59DC
MRSKILFLFLIVSLILHGEINENSIKDNNIIIKIKEIPIRDFVRTDALKQPKELSVVKSYNYRLFYREYFIFENMRIVKKEYNQYGKINEFGYFLNKTQNYDVNKATIINLTQILEKLDEKIYHEFRVESMDLYFFERRRSYLNRSRDFFVKNTNNYIPNLNIRKPDSKGRIKEYSFQTLYEIEIKKDGMKLRFFLGDKLEAYENKAIKELLLWIEKLRKEVNFFVYTNPDSADIEEVREKFRGQK